MAILKIFVLVIFCVFSVVNGDIADQTCLTTDPIRTLDPLDDKAFIGSYIEYVEDPTTLTIIFGQVVNTGGGDNLQTTEPTSIKTKHFVDKRYFYRTMLSVQAGNHRVGAFFCNVTGLRDQTSPSYIPLIILAKEAYIKPEKQTQTVSFGETATIKMTLMEDNAVNLRWRLNGNVTDSWSGSSNITIPYVTKDDIGIYECYLNGRRQESKHAILRLIVRACSASRYGTDCQYLCPTCYNGGVCDDVSGLCVCPPGFKGEDCSEGCGHNNWGRVCAHLCSSSKPGCSGTIGCVPDPLGCSCMAGYKGLNCKGDCTGTGYYGSTCSEQCHCAADVTCDPSRGCPDGPCEAGYSGTNCQVPDSCTNGRYGELCKYQCHCDDDGPCDRNTGSCSDRKCKHLWIGSDCQLDGRTKVTLEDPSSNRGVTSVTITCIVQANPIPSDEDIQVLHGDDILENGVSTATELSYTKTIVFSDITIAEDGVFKCQVQSNISGDAQTEKVVKIYDQPVMTVNPSVIASNSTVTVSWNEWTKSEDNGEGPVIGYYVYYQQTEEAGNPIHSNSIRGLSITFNIAEDNNEVFQRGVQYEFGVAAIRPGSLGRGSISPFTQFIIPCLPPVMMPSNVEVHVVSDSEIQVQWQPISISPDRCNSPSKYTLRYTNDNISHQTKTVLATETMEVVSATISDLDPCTTYYVRVAATNSAGDGPFSDVVQIKTDSEVPNAVKNPYLESGNRSITVMWEAPDYEHCQIEHYKLTYQLENQGLCGENEDASVETETVTELRHTIDNLEPYSRYIIKISSVTRHQSIEGPITTINGITDEDEPLDGPEDIEGMITFNATNEVAGSITINFDSVSCLKRRGEITNYIVQVVDKDGYIIGPEKTSAQHAIITGIYPCATVTPQVAACTSVGCGEFATGPDITMNTAAPGNVSVKVQHHQKFKKMNVTWSVPEVVYCPIVQYQIKYRQTLFDGCLQESHEYTIKNVNGSTTKFILKELDPFSTYEVVVSAGVNKSDNDGIIYGFGRAGFNTTKQRAPKAAPENVDYDTINARSLNFTWEEIPCGFRESSIDKYNYVLEQGNSETTKGTVEGDQRYVVLDNLSPCTTYDFKVKGEGIAGKEPPSANIQATTISEVPTKVENGLITEDGLTFKWDRPRPLTCEIVKYYIEANLTNKDMCHANTNGDSSSFEEQDANIDLSGLEPYSEYVVTISAETDAGIGPAYIQNISTPEQAPLAGPRDVFNTSLSSENATFEWTKIECGSRRGFIRGYKFSIRTKVVEEDILTDDNVTDREYHVTNLKPFTEYIVSVRGFNSFGDSDSNELRFITKESTPTVPRNINILNTDTVSFLIEWSRPEPANGIVISYQLIVVGNEEVLILYNVSDAERDKLVFSYEVRELTPNTNYTIQAAAFTSVGRGPLSDIIYVLTIPGKPGPVSNFQINSTKEKSVTVSWGKPKNPNGEILKYTIKYRILERLFEPDADITGEWIDATECKGELSHNRCMIEDLEPATMYAIEVYASTEAGDGKHLTKNTTTVTPPVPKQPTLKVVSTTDSTITVELFPIEDFIYISNYVILVEKESSAKRRNAEEKLTHKDSPDMYISASFPRDEVPDLFIIGDGKVHNGYYNAPLSKDNKYFLSFRTDDSILRGNQEAFQPGSKKPSIGMILGVLIALIVAVIVLGLIIIKYKRREKNPPKPMLPMSKLKTESRLPHVPSEDTIADTINSYTKPPLKAKPESSKATRVHRPVKIEHLVAYVKKKRMDKEEGFKNDFESLPNEQIHSWDVAKNSENKTKNRYGNIVAYDHCRVVLEPLPGDPHSDYINACYIDGYKQKVAYIATQGPNTASVDDIWRMVWQERSSIIIMVTNLFEAGKKKCEKYWPEKSQTYGSIDVKILNEEQCPQYTIRTFRLTKENESREDREVKQFHFTVWPDMGVPEFANDVLRFIDVVKKTGNFDTGPTIVHCSAGVGRTGTMIAISEMLDMARDEGKINVFNFVNQMRKNRVKMVQTLDQYFFIFDALLEAVVCGQTSTKASDINSFYNSLLTSNTLTKRSYILEQYNALEAMNAVMTEENTAGGRLPANVAKNRFLSKIPIDGSRPYLMTLSSEDSTNYINASFLHGYRGKDMYISTQMPLPNTIADFLCMVYDYKSKLIVMLNDDPSTDQTYGKYWPESGSEQHGPMIIEYVSTENSKAAICRTFQLKNTSRSKEKPREIKQYQYLGWPSSSKIPSSAESVLEFLKLLDREDIPSDAPITVHCKNGMERCGVFCTIHSVLQQLQHEQIVDVFHTIRKFRRSKPNMVSPVSQYEFCFNTVRCYLDAFEIYSNYK